jgi:hypothetical protein
MEDCHIFRIALDKTTIHHVDSSFSHHTVQDNTRLLHQSNNTRKSSNRFNMAFLYKATTSFEIVPFNEIDAGMTRLKIQRVGCYHGFLQHELYGGELAGAPQTIGTVPDKMYGLTQIAAPEHLALQVKSCFGQIISFCMKLDPRSDTMTYYVTMNLYVKHKVLPSNGISVTSLSIVSKLQSMLQTILVKEYPVLTLYSVGTVHHSTRFSWRTMVGRFNTCGSGYIIDCANQKLSEIDRSCHIGSPCADLHGRFFSCLSKKTFDKFKMQNRVYAGQFNTNVVHIDMEPGNYGCLCYT